MNVFTILIPTILIAQFLFNLIVEILNLKNLSPKVPEEFSQECEPEKYQQSQEYLKENTVLALVESGFSLVIMLALMLTGGFNLIDNWARGFGLGSIPTGLIFAGIIFVGLQILSLPFSLYDTFIIEEKYGFNRTTLKTFILDMIKSLVLGSVLGGIAFAGLLWFFETMGTYAWIYCWIALVIFQLGITYIAPTWLMPLFNKFEPLKDQELKADIEQYAHKQNFAMQGIFTMDGSKRSSKSNAFFTGFGKHRRVVLFDTLIAKHTHDELVSILAHEIGHYKKKHILMSMVFSTLQFGLILFLFSLFIDNPQLFKAFGMEHYSIYASFFLFFFIFSPLAMLLRWCSNVISRHNEYEADAYAVYTYKKPEAMISALKKLTLDNLSNLTPHPLKVSLSYSHPTTIQRIKAIKRAVASSQ